MAQNIFVLALDDFHLEYLRGIHHADQYRFHGLLEYRDLVRASRYPMRELLERAEKQLKNFSGSIDGLIAYWDFPASTMAPFLRRRFDLPGPTVESVLRCEHKYWSRLVQREIVPDIVPDFCVVDPFADNPLQQIDIPFPFWLKPIRAHSSHLGFRIEDENELLHALSIIRSKLRRFAEPFNVLLEEADLPPEVRSVDGYKCLAEGIICADRQCTLEGYVYDGEPRIYGTVDSLRNDHHSSFSRYQYPSTLPGELQSRMIDAARKVMRRIGFDDGPFNIEFFYDEKSDHLWVLEINARISKSHCPLFQMVEGSSHHEVAVNLAVG
ncbi:MAG TPA: ATP-grasp domain-containing protein, partial [Desulfuromonadales bacterium]|nr:ATP-grasp domain-containing protein [Desulfuromonadales bacterium]